MSRLSLLVLCPILCNAIALANKTDIDRTLSLAVGKSLIIDTDAEVLRVAVSSPTIADTVAVNSREILVNGLLPGETSLVLWEAGGARIVYSLTVSLSTTRLEAVRAQLATEAGKEHVTIDVENDTVFLRGTVKDVVSAERVATIAGTLGKVINLLYVAKPPVEPQVLLKVRFANVERTASAQLGVDLMSAGHISTAGATSTGQFTLGDALNLLVFRKGFDISATLTALETKGLVEILAEPNLLALDGQQASFVAGGEYPYPTVQSGSSAGAVTIAFREFGVKIKFLPILTQRGSIRLHVAPEVSSLDFANGLVFQGFHVPALVTRKVDTEVELESGQSFVIAGLLDNRVTETLSKVPGIGNIPILGRLFQNRTRTASNSELLVIITPEIVKPIEAGNAVPDLERPKAFMTDAPQVLPAAPGMHTDDPLTDEQKSPTVPLEKLLRNNQALRNRSVTVPDGQAMTDGPIAPAVQQNPLVQAPPAVKNGANSSNSNNPNGVQK